MGKESKPLLQRLVEPVFNAFSGESDWQPQLGEHYSIMNEPIEIKPAQHNPDPTAEMREKADQARQDFKFSRKSQI